MADHEWDTRIGTGDGRRDCDHADFSRGTTVSRSTSYNALSAVGLCLYSSFYVINYSVLETRRPAIRGFSWNFLGLFAFIASLLVWISAVQLVRGNRKGRCPPGNLR